MAKTQTPMERNISKLKSASRLLAETVTEAQELLRERRELEEIMEDFDPNRAENDRYFEEKLRLLRERIGGELRETYYLFELAFREERTDFEPEDGDYKPDVADAFVDGDLFIRIPMLAKRVYAPVHSDSSFYKKEGTAFFRRDLRAAQCQRELAPVERGRLPEGMDVFFAKSTLRRSAMFQTEYRMLSMSECSGILASGDRAFLVYTATTDGLAWGKRNANYDPKIVKAFGAVHGMRLYTAGGGKVPGILLARTPHVLASVFFDRARRKNKSRFGEGLSPLYVIPATDDGGVFIHHILHHDVRKVYYDVLHSFLDSGEYAQNTDAHSQSEYPLVEIATGALCAYGIDMKLDLLAWWYDDVCGLKNDPAAPPRKMICMESQVPYYQKIFGELPVEYIPMTWV